PFQLPLDLRQCALVAIHRQDTLANSDNCRPHQPPQRALLSLRHIALAQEKELRPRTVLSTTQPQHQRNVAHAQIPLRHTPRRVPADSVFDDLHCSLSPFYDTKDKRTVQDVAESQLTRLY